MAGHSALVPIVNGTTDISLLTGSIRALDLTDIQAIRLFIQGVNAAQIVTLSSITATVPEPGTGLLIAAGLVGLALRRRQR